MENPNRPSEKDGIWDAKWFHSGYQVTLDQNELDCGCPGEMGCIHYKWPKSYQETGNTEISLMGLAAEGGLVETREQIRGGVNSGVGIGDQGQPSQQAQHDRQIQEVKQPLGQSVAGELQQAEFHVGMDECQPSKGGTAQGEQRGLREDVNMEMKYQTSSSTQGHMLQTGAGQSNREIGEQAIQQAQRNLAEGNETHALARQALDVIRALEPPQADDLRTFGKAVENSRASQKFSLHLGGRRGNSEKPVEKPE